MFTFVAIPVLEIPATAENFRAEHRPQISSNVTCPRSSPSRVAVLLALQRFRNPYMIDRLNICRGWRQSTLTSRRPFVAPRPRNDQLSPEAVNKLTASGQGRVWQSCSRNHQGLTCGRFGQRSSHHRCRRGHRCAPLPMVPTTDLSRLASPRSVAQSLPRCVIVAGAGPGSRRASFLDHKSALELVPVIFPSGPSAACPPALLSTCRPPVSVLLLGLPAVSIPGSRSYPFLARPLGADSVQRHPGPG